MKKPKELVNEVKKFEDWLDVLEDGLQANRRIILEDLLHKYIHLVWQVKDFYTQPFKPEMIEEYFEGWKKIQEDEYIVEYAKLDSSRDVSILKEVDKMTIYWNATHLSERQFLYKMPIKTLSDFISNCLNSEIKLRWRNEY